MKVISHENSLPKLNNLHSQTCSKLNWTRSWAKALGHPWFEHGLDKKSLRYSVFPAPVHATVAEAAVFQLHRCARGCLL